MNLDLVLQEALARRRREGLYRERSIISSPQQPSLLRNGQRCISFCSNDYLGLANHPEVHARMQDAVGNFGVGSGASHLVSGHFSEHHALEEELAAFVQRPRAVLFSTGYMANVGVINALVSRADEVFEDRLNHASLIDGAKLSAAKFSRFHHNDVAHLGQRLHQSSATRKLIAVDGVFSMDGDYADLPALAACAKAHQGWLMVDDAHGLGCIGEHGRGSLEHFRLGIDEVPVLVGTLGKAFGTFGAFVAGSEVLIESVIQFARTYIYTTALPPAIAAATRASLRIIQHEPERRQRLWQNIAFFKAACGALSIPLMPSDTAIQPIVVGASDKAMALSQQLAEKGFWVSAIRPPTVPQGTARLRVTLCSEHTPAEIEQLVEAIAGALHVLA